MVKETKSGGRGNRRRKPPRGTGSDAEAALKLGGLAAPVEPSPAAATPVVPLERDPDLVVRGRADVVRTGITENKAEAAPAGTPHEQGDRGAVLPQTEQTQPRHGTAGTGVSAGPPAGRTHLADRAAQTGAGAGASPPSRYDSAIGESAGVRPEEPGLGSTATCRPEPEVSGVAASASVTKPPGKPAAVADEAAARSKLAIPEASPQLVATTKEPKEARNTVEPPPAKATETRPAKAAEPPSATALSSPTARAVEPPPAASTEYGRTSALEPTAAAALSPPHADLRPDGVPTETGRSDANGRLDLPPTQADVAAEPEPTPPAEPPAEVHTRPALFIVHITPELAPVAKVGGLGDVVFGLCREMELRGNHVEIVLPKYDSMRYDHIWDLQPCYNDLWVPWYGGTIHCTVYFGMVHGRKCFFIEPHSRDNFFNRGSIYGFHDDLFRFAFFSRAAIEFLWKSGKHPEIIHCHDWQTALVPVFLYEIYQHLGMTHPRVCFTIHNFMHQGLNGMELLRASGLHRPEYYFHYDRLRDNHNPYAINLMKGGIVYSNFVTTVSPRHAGEAKDFGQGFGLDATLKTHAVKYGGVVNGVDYDVWNPGADPHIPVHYDSESLDRKYDNKRALRHRLLMADNEKPIVAFVGRLDPQKGLELVRHAIFYTLGRGGQFVLLGSSPDSRINNDFWGLKRQLNEDPNSHLEVGYNEELAHLIYAGADMLLVPSRFEPCGLTQLIAMRYGTIPIVREVGGLADTVFDKDTSHLALHERNGYVFRDYDNRGLESALGRAISCYYNHYPDFRELMKNAMRYDYSWNHPGRDYLNIYEHIRAR